MRVPQRLLPLVCALWLGGLLDAAPSQERLAPTTPKPGSSSGRSLFSHSDDCMACHNNLVSPDGEDVSIGVAWRATMMANSARDPYWQASVRREAIDHSTNAAKIQDECAACHMPMMQRVAHAAGGVGEVFAHLPFAGDDRSDRKRLAADGVSCTVCHQIGPDRLGMPESFNGGFVLLPARANGVREIVGGHLIDNGRRTIMRSVTGYEQRQATHIRQSELCATCHTLITQALGPDGKPTGSLPEQMNYQEWRHSAFFSEEKSCQSCHMPAAAGPIRISSVLGDERDRLARHAFVGGNAFMLRMLNRYRSDLGVAAMPAELETTARLTLRQLSENTALVRLTSPVFSEETLTFDVEATNLTGHKFPTGYPSRRAWLHVTVRDSLDRVMFESGAVDADGRIRASDSDENASFFEPHYDRITRTDQVQIYESVMGTPAGTPTTGLLQATQYLKDNRLLPRGFDKATADREIAVIGAASADVDFAGGGDRVHYEIAVPQGRGPFLVSAELRYQSIGYRWAQTLAGYDAPEPNRFVRYYNALASSSSVVVAQASATVR